MRVDPQVYYDAARKLTDIGVTIDAATTTLVKALVDTGSMAGTSQAATTWATSYDTRATSVIDNARRLAQTLPYFASLVALAGYNHALADSNADINPNGSAPNRPATVAAPAALCWAGAPSAGGPGDGLVSIAALMDRIHVHVPDGNSDKLAAVAWHNFLNTPAIDNAGSTISDVASALRQNQSHEIADLDDLVMMLSGSANKLYAAANQLATECDNHKQALDDLRRQIKGTIDSLEETTAIALAATIFADLITAGIGVLADTATLAAYGVYFDDAAETITGYINTIDIDRLLTVFAKEDDIAAPITRDLNEIDSLTPQEVEAEETSPAAAGTNWQKLSGIVRDARAGKGNFGIGDGTMADADSAGRAWVGRNAHLSSNGKTWVSNDGLRQYRPPSYKPYLDRYQANFGWRNQPSGQWQGNGHLDIVDTPP